MRSTWLCYVVIPGQNQHNAAAAFLISLGEVFRRFMWNVFRVENEHVSNAKRFMASRDVPLPFSLPEFQSSRRLTKEPDSSRLDYGRVGEERPVRRRAHTENNC